MEGLEIYSSKDQKWASISTSDGLQYSAEKVEIQLKFLQDEIFGEGEIVLELRKAYFPTGQHFLDFARESGMTYKPNDCEQ